MEVKYEVTTAELAAMSSDELRHAVARGRQADECAKELGLLKNMNRMLVDEINEVKGELAKEKEKKQERGVAHENGRLEEDPEDDELPALRLANESLLTRQLMMEAQLAEAARYNSVVSEELAQAQAELKALKESSQKLESRNELLKYELEQLQAGPPGTLRNQPSSSSSKSKLSAEAVAKLQDENGDLIEKVSFLEEKCAKRKTEVTNLRSNVNFLKSKITELTAKIQSNDAMNESALQRLKEQLTAEPIDSIPSSPTPSSSESSSSFKFSVALTGENGAQTNVTGNFTGTADNEHICGILDTQQTALLEAAQQEIQALLSPPSTAEPGDDSTPPASTSIRAYFTTKLEELELMRMRTLKPSSSGGDLHAASDSSSLSAPNLGRQNLTPSPPPALSTPNLHVSTTNNSGVMNWHEYDAAFLVLSVMLLQTLTTTQERLVRKRREYSDLVEDFNEYKRSQATVTPRAAGGSGSRKMSAETQQIAFQKKIIDLEKSVHNLTANCNEKEGHLKELKTKLADAEASIDSKTAQLLEKSQSYEESLVTIAARESDVEKLRQETTKLQDEITALSKDKNALNESIQSLQESLDRSGLDLESTKKELVDWTQKTQSLETQLSSQTQVVETQRSEIGRKDEEIAALHQTAKQQLEKASELEKDIEAKKEEIRVAQQEHTARATELENHLSTLKAQSTAQLAEKDESIQKLRTDVESSSQQLEAKRQECARLTLDVGRLSSELHAQSESLSSVESQLQLTKKELEETRQENAKQNSSIESLTKECATHVAQISALNEDIRTHTDNIANLETQQRRLEKELEMRNEEAKESVRKLTTEMVELGAKKDGEYAQLKAQKEEEIEALRVSLDEKNATLEVTHAKLETTTAELSQTAAESHERHNRVQALESDVEKLEKEKLQLIDMKEKTQTQLDETRTQLDSLTESHTTLSTEHDALKTKSSAQEQDIVVLSIKAKELEAHQKKMPELADESLEAEEKAATKWLEYTLNKEKATSASNPIAALASQLTLGRYSPTLATTQMQQQGAMMGRKITRLADAYRQPSFVASVVNLVKKDAFSEQAIKKLEEQEATQQEAETLRTLEECLVMARNSGMKVFGVTGALLYQGNRRTIVDFSMEAIRLHAIARTSFRVHPELSVLFPGEDEASLEHKRPEKILLQWVNSFVEDYNASHPDIPPRPLVANLGKDFGDGRALGIVMGSINQDWAHLAEPNAIGILKEAMKCLQQAVWMRHLPPFLDSPLPVLRGEENVITIMLALLLDWNTGLSSPLAKIPVVQAPSSSAYLLGASTPARNQVRAVSGANMTDSPMKTPAKAGAHSHASTAFSTPKPHSSSTLPAPHTGTGNRPPGKQSDTPQITVKPVLDEKSRWSFW